MTIDASGFVLRRNWPLLAASSAVFMAGCLATRIGSPSGIFGYLVAWLALMFGVLTAARNAFPRAVAARLRAAPTGLSVDDGAELPNAGIVEVRLVPRRGPDAVVELGLQGGKRLALRARAHDARAIVETLGPRRSRFRLELPFARRYLAMFVLVASFYAFVTQSAEWFATLPASLFFALVLAWLLGFVRGSLVVGADGFTTRWLFRQRFVPFREVAEVTARDRVGVSGVQDTEITLTSGKKLRLRAVEAPNTEEERGAESLAMLTHVTGAIARAHQLLAGGLDVPSLVERGSRSAHEWLMGLDALVRGGGSRYRVAALSPDMLVHVADDPNAAAESRVGAAAALVRMGVDDEAMRARIRISAEACAEPELREVLLALAEARDDATAEAALAALRR